MNRLWRLFMAAFAGCVSLIREDAKIVPEILLTPLGALGFSLLIIFSMGCFIIELPIRWLIQKKICRKRISQLYIINILSDIFFIIDDKVILKKFLLAHKLPLTEQEEYYYYKYYSKAFRFVYCKKMDKENKVFLNELIKFRDEKHEHYLILKLAKIK